MLLSRKLKHFSNSGGKIAAIVILAFSIVAIASFTVVGISIGLVLSTLSLFMLTAHEGIELNTEGKIYRKYSSYFWIKSGAWKSIPDLRKVGVYETTEKIEINNFIQSMSAKRKSFLVRLHPLNSNRTIIFSRKNSLNAARTEAMEVAEKLRVPHDFEVR